MGPKIDIDATRRFLDMKAQRRQKELGERFELALRDVEAIVAMIVEQYKPIRIYQWGSLLDRRLFSEISDIDIALEGIKSAKTFFAIVHSASRMTDLPLDIVQLEKIHPLHAESIRNNGRLVYERGEPA